MARNDQTTSGECGLNKYGKIYAKMDTLGNIITPIKTVEDLEKLTLFLLQICKFSQIFNPFLLILPKATGWWVFEMKSEIQGLNFEEISPCRSLKDRVLL